MIKSFQKAKARQQITIYFGDDNTTVRDGAMVHLAGGVDFQARAGDTLMLINKLGIEGVPGWRAFVEVSRSVAAP